MSATKADGDYESLSLRFRTAEPTAEAAAVSSMLNALVVLVDETNSRIGDGGTFSIRIRPFEAGSLEIPFDLIIKGGVLLAGSLLTINTVASQILKTIQQAVDLKKSLKGKSPENQENGETQIPTVINKVDSVVINIIQNPQVKAALHQAFSEVEKDESIDGIQIVDNKTREEVVDISRQEFPYFKYPEVGDDEEMPAERVRGVRTNLTVHTPVLVGKGRWKFIHEGNTIHASIVDESFLGRVRKGVEKFGAGDRFLVDLEIAEKYDTTTLEYTRTGKYTISRVHEHKPPPPRKTQSMLFQEEDDSG
ncbi:MAG: hypothetical protein JNK57_10920 [Planctomycetaceae bacterium]|nr:hypothetical protein [Planctomycetaceae bacterium]